MKKVLAESADFDSWATIANCLGPGVLVNNGSPSHMVRRQKTAAKQVSPVDKSNASVEKKRRADKKNLIDTIAKMLVINLDGMSEVKKLEEISKRVALLIKYAQRKNFQIFGDIINGTFRPNWNKVTPDK